jgi:hypothetical protein
MVYFRETMGGLEVQVNGKVLGNIGRNGIFFTDPVHLRNHVEVSATDMRKIANKIDETVVRSEQGYLPLPS